MSDIKVNCPHCKQPFEVAENMLGTIAECSSCKQFNMEIQECMSVFDEFLQKWRALHQKYQTTPSANDRDMLRQKIKALEEDFQVK